jgi:hypothetical protein
MSGVLVLPHFDADGKTLTVEQAQDVEDIIENNKRLQAEPQRSDWGREVADIPNIVIVKWMNEAWDRGHYVMPFTKEFGEIVKGKLKDPEWAYLRTDSAAVQGFMGFGS